MNIEQWFQLVTSIFKEKGTQISSEKENFLLSRLPETTTIAQKEIISETINVMTEFFFKRASHGETFGPLSRVKERFGNTIEENYGLSTGPFINMAKTYWTYRLEVADLHPNYHHLVLSKILKGVEEDIASLFFPTPGPMKIPVKKRKEDQRKILEEFVPHIDIDRFLNENPILIADSMEQNGLHSILTDDLKQYCYNRVYDLAIAFNEALLSKLEYELGFYTVMNMLEVPEGERDSILSGTIKIAEASGIPYYKLSPLNQFLKTVVPYVFYCLKKDLPSSLNNVEIKVLEKNNNFFQYLISLGVNISQKKVKGALWKPGAGCLKKVALIIIFCSVAILAITLLF
ncbi:MAG: hypothetical protein ACFFDN_18280 [Candidatus Hodarchaeota archaeon]